MRATTGSRRRPLVPRLAVLGCVLAVVAGCSGSSGTTTAATPTGAGSPATAATGPSPSATTVDTPAGGVVFEISVSGTRVTPQPSRHTVKAGQTVRLILTTDKTNIVHIHGADIERDVTAGVPVTVDFTVDEPGVYPIELHEPELLLTQIVVR